MKTLYLVTGLLFVAFFARSQDVHLNKKYVPENKFEHVALVPVFVNGSAQNDVNSVLYNAFSQQFHVADTARVLHNLLYNKKFNELMNRTTKVEFSKSLLKKAPNLYSSMSEEEISFFQKHLLNADLIIINEDLRKKEIARLNGSFKYILSAKLIIFDLKTGEFVLSVTDKVKANYDSKPADIHPMIKQLYQDIYQKFIEELQQ